MTTRFKLFGTGTALTMAAVLISAQAHPSHAVTNGEITATTPSGSRVTSTSTPARVESAVAPRMRSVSAAK